MFNSQYEMQYYLNYGYLPDEAPEESSNKETINDILNPSNAITEGGGTIALARPSRKEKTPTISTDLPITTIEEPTVVEEPTSIKDIVVEEDATTQDVNTLIENALAEQSLNFDTALEEALSTQATEYEADITELTSTYGTEIANLTTSNANFTGLLDEQSVEYNTKIADLTTELSKATASKQLSSEVMRAGVVNANGGKTLSEQDLDRRRGSVSSAFLGANKAKVKLSNVGKETIANRFSSLNTDNLQIGANV